MSVNEMITYNFAPLAGLAFLVVILAKNDTMKQWEKRLFSVIWLLEFLELAVYNLELYTAILPYPTRLRIFLSVLGYTLRPFLAYSFIKVVQHREKNWQREVLLILPVLLTFFLTCSAFFTDIAFSYDAANQFHRGPFGYISQITTMIYLIILTVYVIRGHFLEAKLEKRIMLLAVAYLFLAMLLEAVFNVRSVGRAAIIYSTIFFMYALQTGRLEKSRQTEDENERLKKTMADLEKVQQELLLNQSAAQVLGEYYMSVLYGDLLHDRVQIRKLEDGYEDMFEQLRSGGVISYDTAMHLYADTFVREEDRERFRDCFERKNLLRNLEKNKYCTLRFNCCREEQESFCVEANVVLSDEADHPDCVVIGLRNVEEQVQKEKQQMREMEKAVMEAKRANAAKSEFLSRMSHDIRTPLNGILGMIEINDRHDKDIELMRANRAKAKVAASHLLSLINDVLQMSRLEDTDVEMEQEVFDIHALSEEVLTIAQMQAAEAGITVLCDDCSMQFKYPYVYGNPLYVRQIMLNILSNAVKYNKPGGSISCKAAFVQSDGETVVYQVVISDTGIGMSKEFLQHIFEPFTQADQGARSSYQGTGLGMAIVKKLIDRMDGSIAIESEPGIGSTFTVSIPFRIASEDACREDSENKELVDLAGMHVLLVEDNNLNREIAKTILEDAQITVDPAENGKMALDLFREKPAYTYQAILMDVMMPVMDGYAATREIRKLEREDAATIPVIAITANAFLEDIKKCREAGMDVHLAKPVTAEKLIDALRQCRTRSRT